MKFQDNMLFLAPLAGYSDMPFRKTCKSFGVDVTVSEMVSSNALIYENDRTKKLLEKSNIETPFIVQIFGNDEKIVGECVKLLNDYDHIDGIDLNCGCPAPKIVNNFAGSYLLKDSPKLKAILKAMKENTTKPISIKMRLGMGEKNYMDTVKIAEDIGLSHIVVHGRTRSDMYDKNRIDYDAIANIKANTTLKVVANGDIDSYQKAIFVKEHTKADALMIGRGAIGNPWIFYQIKNGINDEYLSLETKSEIIKEHLNNMCEFYGDYGVIMFRKHFHKYIKGLRNAREMKEFVNKTSDKSELFDKIDEMFIKEEM